MGNKGDIVVFSDRTFHAQILGVPGNNLAVKAIYPMHRVDQGRPITSYLVLYSDGTLVAATVSPEYTGGKANRPANKIELLRVVKERKDKVGKVEVKPVLPKQQGSSPKYQVTITPPRTNADPNPVATVIDDFNISTCGPDQWSYAEDLKVPSRTPAPEADPNGMQQPALNFGPVGEVGNFGALPIMPL